MSRIMLTLVILVLTACNLEVVPPDAVTYSDSCVRDDSLLDGCAHPGNPDTPPYWERDPDHYGLSCPTGVLPDPARGHFFQFDRDYYCMLPNYTPCPGAFCPQGQQ